MMGKKACSLTFDDRRACRRTAVLTCLNSHTVCRGHYVRDNTVEPARLVCGQCGALCRLNDEIREVFERGEPTAPFGHSDK